MGTRENAFIALIMGIGLPLNLVTFVHRTVVSTGACFAFDGGNGVLGCVPTSIYNLLWGTAIGFLFAGMQQLIRINGG